MYECVCTVYVCDPSQVPARLYAFDVSHQSWKERGRGEVRLNDACQSEGVFQSRLGETHSPLDSTAKLQLLYIYP